ncbi:MAG: M1 family metallopeptidase [Bacteroidetes bacterium]|nr:M1 family metallopeptidase [Bacteroidota bacterium]
MSMFFNQFAFAQVLQPKRMYNLQDSLRGSITPQRIWWDLNHYHLNVQVFPKEKKIGGHVVIQYTALADGHIMQIDLQKPLQMTQIIDEKGRSLQWTQPTENVYWIDTQSDLKKGDKGQITCYYNGNPRKAIRAPWDGGFSWAKDNQGNDFIATSCQGLGASAWWPCKDHMYDEPDSMRISITVIKPYVAVSNGRLESIELNGDNSIYHWVVKNPINNYGVNLNIAKYVDFADAYSGEKGNLDMHFYVLPDDLNKAKLQFTQAKDMLKAFEYWFGSYPFYEDGYKIVQVPYLGMEHQSSVTYGNQFANGYLGMDLSGTGWGKKWDYIIIHESGHEWFANNITYRDIADMWIHEGFTTYSECLFTEFFYGKIAGQEYVIGQRRNISNDAPIIGDYDVNSEGSGDMYYKGANLLNMIRQINNDDVEWRAMLRELNAHFYHQTVTSTEIEEFMSLYLDLNLKPIFDQYLRTKFIPALEVQSGKGKHYVRWSHCIDGFEMPVDLEINGKTVRVLTTQNWTAVPGKFKKGKIKANVNYYIN